MELDEYQRLAMTSKAKGEGSPLIFMETGHPVPAEFAALGLAGEAGEVANLLKKGWRVNGCVDGWRNHTLIKAELGDVMWYMAQLAEIMGTSLNEIAEGNLKKLGIIE